MQEIIEICEKYDIKNYTIRDDGTVDVKVGVYLELLDLTELPLKFGIVTGNFCCHDNQLTSLIGSPKEVGGWFDCSYNQLTSLEGCPKKVGGWFSCRDNELTSLEGAPKELDGSFNCSNNKLTSLKGAPLIVRHNFNCKNNPKDNPKELELPLTIIGG